MTVINLRARFGETFRVAFDPAYDPKGIPKRCLDPWMMTLPGKLGTAYPFGGSTLALECDRHPSAWRKLDALPGVSLHQSGDGERTYLFDAALFPAVAAVYRPRKRRRCHLSAEQRRLAGERLANRRKACV